MTFAPANGGDVDPTEVYFQSDRPLTYDQLTVTNATEIYFGVLNIQTRIVQPSDFTLTGSSMSATSDIVIGRGTTLRLDAASSLTTPDFDHFGTLAGDGTINAFTFVSKSGSTLSPGSSIGTLTFNSAMDFESGSTIITEVDPAAAQKADLMTATDAVTGINNARIQVEAARPGLTPQDYEAGNDYTVFQASAFDGDTPALAAGGSLPALLGLRIANTPTADGRIDIAFTAQPVSSLPQHPAVTNSPNASNLAGAIATATTVSPSTSLTNGTTIGTAVSTLTNAGASGFNLVHAEPYSSNLAIGLEQLDLVSGAVLRQADCGALQHTGFDMSDRPLSTAANLPTDSRPNCADRRWWIDAAYVRGNVEGSGGLGTYDYSLGNLTFGADVYEFDAGIVGLFAGLGRASMDEHDQVVQDFSTDSFHLGGYGHGTAGAWDWSGIIGIMSGKTDAERTNPSVGSFTGGVATASLDQDGFHAGVQARRPMQLENGANLATVLGLNYARIRQGAATESGSGDFLYAIDAADAEALVASVGLDYQREVSTAYGLFTPIAFARYEYDFLADRNGDHEVTVNSPVFGSFTQVGQNRGAHGFVLGLGLGYQISDTARASAGYAYALRSNGYEHGLGANLSVRF
ncbi:autotransporter domain-containing protein [Rhodobacteraceae bacterium KN286]|uniref:Autotransporter domain-containing protein n=2 Tax=Oceanomicrobium pacificus TaxID=2692916 RepID=A0A6B0TYC1_9RHOB|nr:autotransporter domain-containing protein [Oceanomicrobium pacificus]